MRAVAGARRVEDIADGGSIDDITTGPSCFARRREQSDDGYCSTSARPLAITWSPLLCASYAYT